MTISVLTPSDCLSGTLEQFPTSGAPPEEGANQSGVRFGSKADVGVPNRIGPLGANSRHQAGLFKFFAKENTALQLGPASHIG